MSTEKSTSQARAELRQRRMTFWKHVEELRQRLLRAVIGVIIGMGVGLLFVERALDFLLEPMGEAHPVALHPTETIVIYFRLGLLLGLMLAMPYVLYQLIGFLAPGLTRREKRILLVAVFAVGFFFALGVAFAAGVMLPLAILYLRGFLADKVQPTYSIEGYVSFVITIMFSSGVMFQTPLLLALLARLGVVTSRQLGRGRRYALVLIAVLAAAITPTPDAFNMLLVMIPLLGLYELGILLAWFAGRARRKALTTAGMEVAG